MQDFIELGSAPHGEPCTQTGSDDYIRQQQLECIAFTKQIARTCAPAFFDKVIMVLFAGMWLGVEADGHTPS